MPLILRESEVRQLLSMSDCIDLVEEAHRLHAKGEAILAPRLALSLGGDVGTFRIMAAALPEMSTFGLKTLTGIPGRRLPDLTYFTILVFDGETGGFLGLLPAGHITRTRTGAAGGVAVKHLARPDSRTLGVFGAGGTSPRPGGRYPRGPVHRKGADLRRRDGSCGALRFRSPRRGCGSRCRRQ